MKEETRIALLEQNTAEIKQQFTELKVDIKSVSKQVDMVLTTKLTDHMETQSQIRALIETVALLKSQSKAWRYISPILSGLMSSIMTYLVIYYLQNINK